MTNIRRLKMPKSLFFGKTKGSTQTAIGVEEIREAAQVLMKYKQGKANLENRIIEDEEWWRLNHWSMIRHKEQDENGKTVNAKAAQPEPTSAWLFNTIMNKHADAMDNFPEPIVLPREKSDEETAKTLSQVIPVLLDYNSFDEIYSDAWDSKLISGTAVYGAFWNSRKENGLGDIDIREIDILKVFWEPGIKKIQDSKNLFICDLIDKKNLIALYPELEGKELGSTIDIAHYRYDNNVNTEDKVVVVDWYYKVMNQQGKTILHYVKFVGEHLLYASENDDAYRDRGFYTHGKYPVVFDTLFHDQGTPAGFGLVTICKDPQMYIDKLSSYILESTMQNVKKRFFVSDSANINEDEFLDWTKPFVHVSGEVSDARVKEIVTQPVSSNALNILQMKIDEMKDTAANRDVNSGGTGSGVTAASAIAALQEAGNKNSRDMIAASYRAYSDIVLLCIELIGQFYNTERTFRITGPNPGTYDFIAISRDGIGETQVTNEAGQPIILNDNHPAMRKPVFDLKVSAQKKNPFSRMEENERAKELFAMGFFNPDRAQEALSALEMMDFEGIEKVKEKVQEGSSLINMLNQMSQMIQILSGQNQPVLGMNNPRGAISQAPKEVGSNGLASGIMKAQTPQSGYAQKLAQRSTPSMDNLSDAANPGV